MYGIRGISAREFIRDERVWCGVQNEALIPKTAAWSEILAAYLLTDTAGGNGERKEFGMLAECIVKRNAVVYDDIAAAEVGLRKMPAVVPAENLHMK